jgi:hypothetical protein
MPPLDWTVELSGSGLEAPVALSFEQLGRMEMIRVTDALMQRTHEPDITTSWQGPSIYALLAAARVKPGLMNVTFEAVDGYRKTCTLAELGSAILALKNGEGQWLVQADARSVMRLIIPQKPGDYWVANLRRIIVEPRAEERPSE